MQRRLYCSICIASLILVGWGRPTDAAPIVQDQFVNGVSTTSFGTTPTVSRGQSFTVGVAGQLTQIDVNLTATADDITLNLHPLVAGVPDLGTILATRTLSAVTASSDWVAFDITSSNVAVNVSDQLAYMLLPNGNITPKGDASSTYSGGDPWVSISGGTPTINPSGGNWDISLRTFVDTNPSFTSTAAPEPSTFALGALGLLSLGMTRRRRRR